MKLKRFLQKLFPKEFFKAQILVLLLCSGIIAALLSVFYILGQVANYSGWFPDLRDILDKGALTFGVITMLLLFRAEKFLKQEGFTDEEIAKVRQWLEKNK